MAIELDLIPGTLPAGVCYTTEQQRLNAYMSVSFAQLNGQTFYNFGPTAPAVEFQSYPWFNTNDGRWYYYQGRWRSPVNYSFYERRFFEGTEAQLELYDGGESGVPMWEIDTNYAGRSPIGVGEIPASNPVTTLTVGQNGGEGAHTQTVLEMPEHSHPPHEDYGSFAGFVSPGQPSSYEIGGGSEIDQMGSTGNTGGGEAMPIVHPVRAIYIIKWTGKLYRYAI